MVEMPVARAREDVTHKRDGAKRGVLERRCACIREAKMRTVASPRMQPLAGAVCQAHPLRSMSLFHGVGPRTWSALRGRVPTEPSRGPATDKGSNDQAAYQSRVISRPLHNVPGFAVQGVLLSREIT